MSVASLPSDEPDRLAALSGLQIMDTEPDARFDNLVRLAADLYGTPIALVSLLDQERQWFKAAHGLEARQTHRDHAFCSHAILDSTQVMVVEDAALDPRFSDNPLVLGDPKIRFYAGAVVKAPSGQPMGTLCVIDHAPRTMDDDGRKRLQNLADGVSTLLDMHLTSIRLQKAATHDPLTGIANRAQFDVRLDRAVIDALSGQPCALMLLDLDRFKEINDTFGHAAGDRLLCEVASRLNRTVRVADLVARLGGDEFAVIMPHPADGAAAEALAARLKQVLAVPIVLEGIEVAVEASIGIALCPLHATASGPLQRAADEALYHVKRRFPGGCAVASNSDTRPTLLRGSDGKRDLGTDLGEAIQEGTLQLHWQPIFGGLELDLHGYEVLQRWDRPGHGPVSPQVFIPYAEANGQIAVLDTWALKTACMRAASWKSTCKIFVNLSAHWFRGNDVVRLVAEALSESGLSPDRLCVEMTEYTLVANRDIARIQIDTLHKLGIKVALDDFGVGFSSLLYLRDLPFDILKLDGKFVSSLGVSHSSDTVAVSIVKLGQQLGMQVCAEGIETERQLAILQDSRCDLFQGFLLGRPNGKPTPNFGLPDSAD